MKCWCGVLHCWIHQTQIGNAYWHVPIGIHPTVPVSQVNATKQTLLAPVFPCHSGYRWGAKGTFEAFAGKGLSPKGTQTWYGTIRFGVIVAGIGPGLCVLGCFTHSSK